MPVMRRPMLTLPNLLTLSRIVAVPLLVALLWWPRWEGGYVWAFALYCLMGITDYFDGYVARSQGAVSKLGQFLDPIADKIMIAAVILALAAKGVLTGPYVGDLHVVAGLVILIREIAVSGLREFLGTLDEHGSGIRPETGSDEIVERLGKVSMALAIQSLELRSVLRKSVEQQHLESGDIEMF